MEFDEEQDEEIEMSSPVQGGGDGEDDVVGARKGVEDDGGGGGGGVGTSRTTSYRYRECLKNHAVGIGGHAVDGCGEFMAGGEEGTLDALKCAACNCHRNFHRKETEGRVVEERFPPPPPLHYHHHHSSSQYHSHFSPSPYSFRSPHPPSGYLHVTPNNNNNNNQRQLTLPSTSRGEDQEDVSNPSSSGGGGGGGGGLKKRRFRTKFTQEQKEKMLGLAERLGWRIQKQDEGMVQQFCAETNVKRHVLKVWMHNNKHTLSKTN